MRVAEARKLDVPAWSARLATLDDAPFVYAGWLNAAHRTYPNMHAQDFFVEERARVQRIIEGSVTAVASLADDPSELLGFVVYGKWRKTLAVHFAFVKPEARRQRVFTGLLAWANHEGLPVVMTAAAQDERVMSALVKRRIYDQRVLPLMQRDGR